MGQEEVKAIENINITVYSDGSGNTFDSDGGWAFRILINDVHLIDGSGYLEKATNNVAELKSAIEGLKKAKEYISSYKEVHEGLNVEYNVTLVSDSQLTLGYANGVYQCKAIHLSKFYIELRNLYNELDAKTRWVKGHSGEEHNEACDKLAKKARESKGK